jgi:Transposase family tnp2
MPLLEIHFQERGPRSTLSKAASLSSLVLETLFFTPRRALRVHLSGIRDLLRAGGASPETIATIPRDPRVCASQFRLDPITRQFLSCPKCYCLYPYNPGDSPDDNLHPAPLHCTHQSTPTSSICNTLLWKKHDIGGGRVRSLPCRKYLHQDLPQWVGCLLARKKIEDILDGYPCGPPADPNSPINDIWLSKVFLDLRDTSGNPFFPPPVGEGRLVFSLAVDSFNPFHVKAAGKVASSTGIWLVLLNFPPHLRYLPENVCQVGVIPDKPSLAEINHALQLMVDDLLKFWEQGVFFSRTYNYRSGKHVHAMLVPFIADMQAARQVIGLAGSATSHSFCTACDLDIADINVMDKSAWPPKDVNHIRRFATLWKTARSEKHRDQIFDACGLRWSPLLDLPYWDPVRYMVIDSMHCLDLGLLRTHCRTIFQINLKTDGGDGATVDPPLVSDEPTGPRNKVELSQLRKCLRLIRSNEKDMVYSILSFPRRILVIICIDNDIRCSKGLIVGTKWILAQNIYHWVCCLLYFLHKCAS